ncbi:TraM recognition domain-containing protein, partial [Leptolyngbya sp. GGD]|uniref:TraM recognition domain-containing protein n=1 Tax=Leptolyngbya sp. GGD TaxID=2997907 RepID=UPI00227C67A3
GLPPISDASTAKHYDRLAADAVYRIVRALDSLGLAWSIDDVAVALGSFTLAYPYLHGLLKSMNAQEALLELAHFATTYRTQKGTIDVQKLADNVRGIASELHSIAAGDAGELFCATHSDLRLTEAIAQGKLIYFMLPRLEESEGAARMLKVFREDLEVSIGEITSHEHIRLDDPHLVIIDEGASTFSPTWANLFELARKGRFALLFGAQSTAGLSDPSLGLSSAFYKRVMANVNLKVAMRLGDNETACELSEWMGKKTVIKKSVSHSTSQGRSGAPLTMLNTKLQSGQSSTESFYEETEERVSPDDLKYGLLAEKGLAWVDMGGKLIKMRSLWVDFYLSERWTGRATLPRYEVSEKDSLGLRSFINREVREREIFREPLKAPASPPDESLLPKAPIETFKLSSDAPSSLRYRKTLVISPDTAQESQSTIIFPKKIAR